jgi:oxygen-independent coproporphyrinogen-3 oxidase
MKIQESIKKRAGQAPAGSFPAHLYVHLPFCLSRCHYCAFPSIAVAEVPEKEYLKALLSEFRFRRKSWPGSLQPLATLYFGGGTPSLFSPAFFSEIIDFFAHELGFIDEPELTLEANPADIEKTRISGYLAAGINRISLGAQTFSTAGLRLLGRRHNAAMIGRAVSVLRQAQVENLSLDLIYAWPGQGAAELLYDLQALIALEPEHVSAYSLSFEPGCELTKAVAAGNLQPVNEDLQLEMMHLLEDNLDNAGLCRYEVSNFARGQRRQSRHNLAYWQLKDFVGLGAGACGGRHCRKTHEHWVERYSNTPDPYFYMQQLQQVDFESFSEDCAAAWCEKESVDFTSAFSEALMLGLRLRSGIDLILLESEYGSEKVAQVVSKAHLLRAEGMLEINTSRLRVTDSGLYLTDTIVNHLL